MTTKKLRTNGSTQVSPVISFNFAKQDSTTCGLHTQFERLSTQLAQEQPRWNGKILLHLEEQKALAIYNILTSTPISTLTIPFTPYCMTSFGTNLLFNARETKQLFLVDKQLTEYTCVYTTNDTINTLLSLPNRTVAVGTTNGIKIINNDWVCIKHLHEENTIDMIALKDGRIVSIHEEDSTVRVCIWDKSWEQQQFVELEDCYRIVELDSGICVYGDIVAFDVEKTVKIQQRDDCTYIMPLKCGLRVEFSSEESKLRVYDGEKLIREKSGTVENTWQGAVVEVSTGIIAWEDENNTLMMYDVDRDLFVEGFPMPLHPEIATLRGFIYDT
jgi:hypothetical protein